MLDADPYAAFSSPVDSSPASTSVPAPASVPAPFAPVQDQPAPDINAVIARNARYQQIANTQGADGVIAALKAEGVDPATIDEKAIRDGVAAHAAVSTIGVPQKPVAAAPPTQDPSDPYAAFSSPVEAAPPSSPGGAAAAGGSDGAPPQAQTASEGIGGGVRNTLEGAGQFLNTVTTPIRAPMAAIGLPVDYAADASAIADKLGLSHIDGVAGAIQKGMAEGLITAGAGTALGAADGIAGTVGKFVGDSPIAQTVSSGTAQGSGEAAKEDGYGVVGQTVASLAGGLAGAGVSVGLPTAAKSVAPLVTNDFSKWDPNAILDAFQRQNAANVEQGAAPLRPIAANVGGFAPKMATAGTKATLGGLPLAAAAERTIAGAMTMRNRIAASIGRVAPDDVAGGQAAIRGAKNLIQTTEARGGKLYDSISIPDSRLATLSDTRQTLAQLNAGLDSNPELSKLLQDGRLKAFEQALTPKEVLVDRYLPGGGKGQPFKARQGGELSWEDLKRFRTYIGELAGRQTLQDSTSKEALQGLYGALSRDMRASAAKESPQALAQFERANTFWRARQDRIDNTLSFIIGNDGRNTPEAAFAQIQRWAKEGGNFAAVGRALRSMSPDEANQVRATIFSRLGNAPIRGHGEEAAFSPNYFMKHWTSLDPRAKAVLFPGEKYRADLDDIAAISKSLIASEGFTNTSRTALASHIGGNLLGVGALTLISHPLGLALEGAGYGAGHLLANPRFAAWLASSARKPAGAAALAHINRLTSIAVGEPAIANEVLALQQKLATAFQPTTLAADRKADKR